MVSSQNGYKFSMNILVNCQKATYFISKAELFN